MSSLVGRGDAYCRAGWAVTRAPWYSAQRYTSYNMSSSGASASGASASGGTSGGGRGPGWTRSFADTYCGGQATQGYSVPLYKHQEGQEGTGAAGAAGAAGGAGATSDSEAEEGVVFFGRATRRLQVRSWVLFEGCYWSVLGVSRCV